MSEPEFKYKNILLIEDVEIDQTIVEAGLNIVAPKSNLTKFFNCTSALDYLQSANKEELPDLLITDMKLPGMNVRELIDQLLPLMSKQDIKCDVIVYSAYFEFEREFVQKLKTNPLVIAMLEKPMDLGALAEIGSVTKAKLQN